MSGVSPRSRPETAGDAPRSRPRNSGGAPLADVRVLDLTRLLPGGFCTQLLADFGADVIKVEDMGMGDYIRWAPPFYGREDDRSRGAASALYLSLNRNKRAIRLNLKHEEGREALLRLVESADILVEGFRPGVMERLGVGYERLCEVNPALVYCAITGYGQDGPLRDRAGHDQNYLALNGVLGLIGAAGGPPTLAGVQVADLGGAMAAAFGIMAALHRARRDGEGELVDISMTDSAMTLLAMVAGKYLRDGEVPRRGEDVLTGRYLCYRTYEAADGWVSCGALEPKFWAAFCNGVGRPDLIEAQFEETGSDAWKEVTAIFAARTREQWAEFNAEHDCCIEPVLDIDQVLDSELIRAREMITSWEQPGLGQVSQLSGPVKAGGGRPGARSPAPEFGQHTEEVLSEAGYSPEEIMQLLAEGAAAGLPEPGAGEPAGEFRI